MKLRVHILLAFLIIIKIVIGSVYMFKVGFDSFLMKDAIASESREDTKEALKKDKKNKDENKDKKEEIDPQFLIKWQFQLKKEEARIKKKERELLAIQNEINNKIARITQLRNEIEQEKRKKEEAQGQKFKHLIKVYSAMKPQSAASLIEKLSEEDLDLAVKILSRMKGDNVGKILSYVKIEKAAKISKGLVKKN